MCLEGGGAALSDGWIGVRVETGWGMLVFPLPGIWLEALPVLLHVKIASTFTLWNNRWSSLGCFKMNYYNVMDKKDALAEFVVTKSL